MRASVRAILRHDDEVGAAIREACPPDLAFEAEVSEAGAAEVLAGRQVKAEFLVLDARGLDPAEEVRRLAGSATGGEIETVVVGDRDGVEVYRALTQMGVGEYVVAGKDDVKSVVRAALDRLERGRRARGVGSVPEEILTVLGIGGGDGASTIAAGIARLAAERMGRCLLAELSLAGTQHLAFDAPSSTGWLDVVKGPKRLDALMLERLVSRGEERLALLSANEVFDDPAAYHADTIPTLAARAHGSGFKRLILDASRNAAGRDAAMLAGTVVLVARPTLSALEAAARLVPILTDRGERRIITVLNKVGEALRGEIPADEFERRYERPVLVIPFDRGVPRSQLAGEPIKPQSKAGRAVGRVAAEALGLQPEAETLLDRLRDLVRRD